MKNIILDEIIKEEYHSLLKENEKVIWKGKPYSTIDQNFPYSRNSFKVWVEDIAIIFIPYILPAFIHLLKKRTRYIITNQRIIFRIWTLTSQGHYSIPFSDIEKITLEKGNNGFGTVFLSKKKHKQFNFQTYNISTGEYRDKPTLEMVGDCNLVAEYIEKGIQKKL